MDILGIINNLLQHKQNTQQGNPINPIQPGIPHSSLIIQGHPPVPEGASVMSNGLPHVLTNGVWRIAPSAFQPIQQQPLQQQVKTKSLPQQQTIATSY